MVKSEKLLKLSELFQKQKGGENFEAIEINDEQKALISDIDEALRNISSLSDKEVKDLYDKLKVNYYLDSSERRLGHKYNDKFTMYENAFNSMLKADKMRSIGVPLKSCKYISAVAAIYSAVYLLRNDGVVFSAPALPFSDNYVIANNGGLLQTDLNMIEYYQQLVSTNLDNFVNSSQIEIVGGAFALGLALYLGGKGAIKYSDVKTMRRLMVQAMGQDMSAEEIDELKQKFSTTHNVEFVGETSVASIKEASRTYPLKNYCSTSDRENKDCTNDSKNGNRIEDELER